jgi:hypothetical protein
MSKCERPQSARIGICCSIVGVSNCLGVSDFAVTRNNGNDAGQLAGVDVRLKRWRNSG